MSINVLLEAAVRSAVLGSLIYGALTLLQVRQARAQRTAWMLALVGAFAMPALVALQIGPRLIPDWQITHTAPTESRRVEFIARDAVVAADPVRRTARTAAHATLPAPRNSTEMTFAGFALYGYCTVAAVLLLRLAVGLGGALRLRRRARSVAVGTDRDADIRVSADVGSPVTVFSSVLLPPTFGAWDERTLRVVLQHESAHVRQRDFYVQLLAGVHCAVFWFSPFSWFVRHRLSELGEALSDRAAVTQAQSRESYAQILLNFAAGNGRTWAPLFSTAGVSMARSSNLAPRIERLLDDQAFDHCFSDSPRVRLAAMGVVAVALMVATAMVKVHAAPTVVAPNLPASPASPTPPAPPEARDEERDTNVEISDDDPSAAESAHDQTLVIHTGHSHTMFQGRRDRDFRRIERTLSGDYIYYRYLGRPYVTQDPAIIAQAKALLAPTQDLGLQQRMLGTRQAMLGREQEKLGMQQVSSTVVTPDFQRDIADLDAVVKKMKLAKASPKITPEELAELQAKLGEIQGRLGELQGHAAMNQGRYGEQQARLGEMQGKLGEEQGRLGEQQRKLVEEAQRQLKTALEKAIHEGTLKPIADARVAPIARWSFQPVA